MATRDMTHSIRRTTHSVFVGTVGIGSKFPIRVQSMTNTDTADIAATTAQIIELAQAGSEIVRCTVNNDAAALAVPEIIKRIRDSGCTAPIVGDFHYNGHVLLKKYVACAVALDKYRINPGNVGGGILHDKNFSEIISIAREFDKPIRIGVNGGSLDSELLTRNMATNAGLKNPISARDVYINSLVESALSSATRACDLGLCGDKIIVSIKASDVATCVEVNRRLAALCSYPLHIGLTEAGVAVPAIVSSTVAMSKILAGGIGDTIRVSLTPTQSTKRTQEIDVARAILQSLGLVDFIPRVTSCPGCGRAENLAFQRVVSRVNEFVSSRIEVWKKIDSRACEKKIAVMGCVVNGPGESRNADIALSFPGRSEEPRAIVFIDGNVARTLIGTVDQIEADFLSMLDLYFLTSSTK